MRQFVMGAACAWLALAASMLGCAPTPDLDPTQGPRTFGVLGTEVPPPDGPWRPHVLERCTDADGDGPSRSDLDIMALARELYGLGEGGDAILELELYLSEKRVRHGLVWLALGQLYVLAAQGSPAVEPNEGPAAMTGDWSRDRPRLVDRAETVLQTAARLRPDDGAVEYLLADAARCRDAMATANQLFARGRTKCILMSSMDILTDYQDQGPHPARQESGVEMTYPPSAARDGVGGEVVLDLLISPLGEIAQISVVSEPDPRLGTAAATALLDAEFSAGRIGKYPVWSWARVTVSFG